MGAKALAAWLMVAGAVAGGAGPREVVQSAVDRVVAVVERSQAGDAEDGRSGPDRRRAELRRIAAELFDFEEMARRTLPRQWATLAPADQGEFVRLFTELLERTYVGTVEAYVGERITYAGESVEGRYALVRSRVAGRRGGETLLDYRLHLTEGRWRVYDLVVDGMSFVATYRTQFTRVLQQGSWAELRDRLRQRTLEVDLVGARSVRRP